MPFTNTILNSKIIQLQSEICTLEDWITERNEFITHLKDRLSYFLVLKLRLEAQAGAGHVHEPEDCVIYHRTCFMLLDIHAWIEETRDHLADDELELESLWRQLHVAVLVE